MAKGDFTVRYREPEFAGGRVVSLQWMAGGQLATGLDGEEGAGTYEWVHLQPKQALELARRLVAYAKGRP